MNSNLSLTCTNLNLNINLNILKKILNNIALAIKEPNLSEQVQGDWAKFDLSIQIWVKHKLSIYEASWIRAELNPSPKMSFTLFGLDSVWIQLYYTV